MKISTFDSGITNDKIIRSALIKELEILYKKYEHPFKIFSELGLRHGTTRIDIAVINGVMHGYEIKSDQDTLGRLPEQMDAYSAVFNQVTIVVGKKHLFDVINIVPDWWGIIVARADSNNLVTLNHIRKAGCNPEQDKVSVAKLLWRNEALEILEERGEAQGFRSKSRATIYTKLAVTLDTKTLNKKVRDTLLFFRTDWRSDLSPVLNGD